MSCYDSLRFIDSLNDHLMRSLAMVVHAYLCAEDHLRSLKIDSRLLLLLRRLGENIKERRMGGDSVVKLIELKLY